MLRVNDRFSNLGFRRGRGFTLIELLIVIAIILILIAIALPNFLEAQIRARVTKAKGEIRSLATAMEAYFLDFKKYPAESEDNCQDPNGNRTRLSCGLLWLSSPIKYITSIPEDPFPGTGDLTRPTYEMGGVECSLNCGLTLDKQATLVTWAMYTRAPDAPIEEILSADPHERPTSADGILDTYAPTNGTKSAGDIYQFGGDSRFIGTTCGGAYNCNPMDPSKVTPGGGLNVDGVFHLHKLPRGVF
jgi:type II secretion system protein G